MKYTFKLVLAFLKRFGVIILISTIIGLLFFFLFQGSLSGIFQNKNIKIGVTGRYTTEELPEHILKSISSGLTTVNDDGIVSPQLASWESKDDGREWIFTLKDDIFWQDGNRLKVEEVNYEFSDVEVTQLNERSLSFKLEDPFAPFPSVVTKPIFKKGLLGVGEWEVEKLSFNGSYVQQLVLVDKEDNKIVYKFYPTEVATKNAFKLGQVDRIENISDPKPLNIWKTSIVNKSTSVNQIVTLFFNTQDNFLGDKTVRQALIYAFDKNSMGDRALGPIPITSWAYNPQVKEYALDIAKSKEIIEELPKEVLESAEIKIETTPLLLADAEYIANAWNEIGVKTTVHVTPVVPSEFQVYLTILDLPKDPDQYPLWHSTQTETNISRYSNPRIDKLLEDGRSELDMEERRKIYLDFQRFLMEDVPAAFLYYPTYYNISRK